MLYYTITSNFQFILCLHLHNVYVDWRPQRISYSDYDGRPCQRNFYLHQQVPDPMLIPGTDEPLSLAESWLTYVPCFCGFNRYLSAYLYQAKNNSVQMTREFLLKRGLFLIFSNWSLSTSLGLDSSPDVIYLQVIWAIGLSMVVLAGLIGLSQKWLWWSVWHYFWT